MTATLARIICIDDDEDVLSIAAMSLEDVGGFSVIRCHSGYEGIEKASAQTPDLILLDVMMPKMDGPATLEALRRVPALKSVPVIFMTARVQQQDIEKYMGLGAAGVIQKPFNPMELPAQVTAIWQRAGKTSP